MDAAADADSPTAVFRGLAIAALPSLLLWAMILIAAHDML